MLDPVLYHTKCTFRACNAISHLPQNYNIIFIAPNNFLTNDEKKLKTPIIGVKRRNNEKNEYFCINKTYPPMENEERTVLYLHGFASAGSSGTATHLRNSLYEYGIKVVAPDIPPMPTEAMEMLQRLVAEISPCLIVGTSMGAFYAEQIHGIPRILVNPSFHTARLLTFRGLGKREYRNKREDGAKDFKVDKEMINQFKELEKNSFQQITEAEKELVWGLFGLQDKNVNCQPDFKKHYGNTHFITYQGEHYLNDQALKKTVFPLVKQLLQLT